MLWIKIFIIFLFCKAVFVSLLYESMYVQRVYKIQASIKRNKKQKFADKMGLDLTCFQLWDTNNAKKWRMKKMLVRANIFDTNRVSQQNIVTTDQSGPRQSVTIQQYNFIIDILIVKLWRIVGNNGYIMILKYSSIQCQHLNSILFCPLPSFRHKIVFIKSCQKHPNWLYF